MRPALVFALALAALVPARAEPRNPLGALRLEALAVTRQRPLFRPSRRPPPPPHIEAPPPPAPVAEDKPVVFGPPPFDLIGSIVGPRTAYVLLRNHATGKIERMRRGDGSEGWRVGAIGMRKVTLKRDGRTEVLALAAPQAGADASRGIQLAGASTPADGGLPRPEARAIFGGMRRHR